MALVFCDQNLDLVEVCDSVKIRYLNEQKKEISISDLKVAWIREFPILKARQIQLKTDTESHFLTKYNIFHFYTDSRRDYLEIKDPELS